MHQSPLTQNITLPTGFTVRPAQLSDNDAVVDLHNTISMRLRGTNETEPDAFAKEWTEPDFNINASTRVVFNNEGHLVGYTAFWDNNDLPILAYIALVVHPDYEDQRVGEYLLAWIESIAPRVIDKCPPHARVALRMGADDVEKGKIALIEQNGFQAVRHWWEMLIERPTIIPEPNVPGGLSITTFNPDDEAQLHALIQADRDGFRDHWGFVDHSWDDLVKWWTHWIETITDFDPSIWFLAMDDSSGQVAGISLCIPTYHNDPNFGYLDSLAVLRPWRRRGLGLTLLHHSFKELWARGKRKIALGVDATSLTGATRLYEKAGMHVHRNGISFEKVIREGQDLSTTEIAVTTEKS